MSAPIQVGPALETAAAQAMRRAAERLAGLQAADGQWAPANRVKIDKAARSILARQLPDGGFNIYAGGPSEVSASVKAYFALKLAGLMPQDSRMARLRERILELGGIQAANSYVKVNLSLFDQYPREHSPCIAPEVV